MRVPLLTLIAALVFVPSIARAQGDLSVPCTDQAGGVLSYGVGSSKTGPFTATARSTFEQHLYDGNIIHTEVIIRQARDSAGRVREERQEGCAMGLDGQMHPRINISINDPTAKENISWTVGDPLSPKVVRIMHYSPLAVPRTNPATSTAEDQQLAAERLRLAQLQAQSQRNETSTEQLGTRSFLGYETTGIRITQTIPAGKEGNQLPLVIVTENWRSRSLGFTLYGVRYDPRRGKSTFEYTELVPGEPDASLFVPPPDYKVQENNLGGGIVSEVIDSAPPPQ